MPTAKNAKIMRLENLALYGIQYMHPKTAVQRTCDAAAAAYSYRYIHVRDNYCMAAHTAFVQD